jgi:PAT family beta-lactamase induction signal transducer AmpG
MAWSMTIGVAATLLAPEPERIIERPARVGDAFIGPVAEFFKRRGVVMALMVMGVIFFFRFGYMITTPMNSPFLIKLGFTPAELGYWRKGVGLIATLAGGLCAGPLVARLGTLRALLVFGITQALIHLSWVALVYTGPKWWMLAVTIGVENFFIGLAATAFDAYLLTLTNASFSATQFAAFNSLSSLSKPLFGSFSGKLAEALGWPLFFGLTSVTALPSLVLVLVLRRRERNADAAVAQGVEAAR